MAQFVKHSKYKHVFCNAPRAESTFTNLRLSTVTGEQNYIKANPLYFAVAVQVKLYHYYSYIAFFLLFNV